MTAHHVTRGSARESAARPGDGGRALAHDPTMASAEAPPAPLAFVERPPVAAKHPSDTAHMIDRDLELLHHAAPLPAARVIHARGAHALDEAEPVARLSLIHI